MSITSVYVCVVSDKLIRVTTLIYRKIDRKGENRIEDELMAK